MCVSNLFVINWIGLKYSSECFFEVSFFEQVWRGCTVYILVNLFVYISQLSFLFVGWDVCSLVEEYLDLFYCWTNLSFSQIKPNWGSKTFRKTLFTTSLYLLLLDCLININNQQPVFLSQSWMFLCLCNLWILCDIWLLDYALLLLTWRSFLFNLFVSLQQFFSPFKKSTFSLRFQFFLLLYCLFCRIFKHPVPIFLHILMQVLYTSLWAGLETEVIN